MPATTIMTDGAYKLLAWFSPAMPIGAYSYSHGLEVRGGGGLGERRPGPSRLSSKRRFATARASSTRACCARPTAPAATASAKTARWPTS